MFCISSTDLIKAGAAIAAKQEDSSSNGETKIYFTLLKDCSSSICFVVKLGSISSRADTMLFFVAGLMFRISPMSDYLCLLLHFKTYPPVSPLLTNTSLQLNS